MSSLVIIKCDGALDSWRWMKTCLPVGSSKLIPWVFLLVSIAFALDLSITVFISIQGFSSLLLFCLSPLCHCGGKPAIDYMVLNCQLGLSQPRVFREFYFYISISLIRKSLVKSFDYLTRSSQIPTGVKAVSVWTIIPYP